jgi:hypothetical protein
VAEGCVEVRGDGEIGVVRMATLSGSVRLRPTRIGFLVRPGDIASVRKIMRLCTCLWGGTYNPIIPVGRSLPKSWRKKPFLRGQSLSVAKGYVRFFEPDVFVESEPGLARQVGIVETKRPLETTRTASLREFIRLEDGLRPSFYYGQDVFELYKDLYERKYQFVQKREWKFLRFQQSGPNATFAEVAYGTFPWNKHINYIQQAYSDVFTPTTVQASGDIWRKYVRGDVVVPFQIGRENLDRAWSPWHGQDLTLFVFDPADFGDLIDAWNIRQFKENVFLVPVEWLEELKDDLCAMISQNFRPLRGNPHGVMHSALIQLSSSISKDDAKLIPNKFFAGAPSDSFSVAHWYDGIWHSNITDRFSNPRRVTLTHKTRGFELRVDADQESSNWIDSLSPDFADQYSGHEARWANVIRLNTRFSSANVATVFPTKE